MNIKNFKKEDLIKEVYQNFNVGDRFIRADAKVFLQRIYDSVGYERTAKASDLNEYFEIKPIRIGEDRVSGIEIIKQKVNNPHFYIFLEIGNT